MITGLAQTGYTAEREEELEILIHQVLIKITDYQPEKSDFRNMKKNG